MYREMGIRMRTLCQNLFLKFPATDAGICMDYRILDQYIIWTSKKQLPQNSENPWNGNVFPEITCNRITMHYFDLQKTKVFAIQISHTRFSRLEVIFVALLNCKNFLSEANFFCF